MLRHFKNQTLIFRSNLFKRYIISHAQPLTKRFYTLSTREIRIKFIDYFQNHGHQPVSSSKLIPSMDSTLLFTNAGMVQFKDVFAGREKRHYDKACSIQKCIRAGGKHNDLDNVGYTARHHTFFEMLGNFSFGGYFKERAIELAWKFVTEELRLPVDRLRVTVYESDDEAAAIWKSVAKLPEEKILRCGEKDNFWSMGDGEGPCGPCSEIFYDQRREDVDGERWLEIWNLVFMQYYREANGELTPLKVPMVDTGMGLERIAAVVQNKFTNYENDLLSELMKNAKQLIQNRIETELDTNSQNISVGLKVIVDHLRSISFLIADGVYPAATGRGYVLRQIIRRAVRFAHQFGVQKPFLAELHPSLVESMGDVYPELVQRSDVIQNIMSQEEALFMKTLEHALPILEKSMKKKQGKVLPGSVAFDLHSTYGLPFDMTKMIAKERGWDVDEIGFQKHLVEFKKLASTSWKGSTNSSVPEQVRWWKEYNIEPKFVGYEQTSCHADITAVSMDTNGSAWIAIDPCPFYGEGGGQVGDRGIITVGNSTLQVVDTQRPYEGCLALKVTGEKEALAKLKLGTKVLAEVDRNHRKLTKAHHTATHVLHAALKAILGKNVNQAGSLVAPERLRFDFTHPSALTHKQLTAIESWVNNVIEKGISVTTQLLPKEEAFSQGAVHLFDENYPDIVRVVKIGDESIELCGGTHVSNVQELFPFRILSESSVSGGIRRIEAVAGQAAVNLLLERSNMISTLCKHLTSTPENVESRVLDIMSQNSRMKKQIDKLKSALASLSIENSRQWIGTLPEKQYTIRIYNVDPSLIEEPLKALRVKVFELKSKSPEEIHLIICGKIFVLGSGLKEDYHSGSIVREMLKRCAGSGGGTQDIGQGSLKESAWYKENTKTWRDILAWINAESK